MDQTKLYQADLNGPCRELSKGGLGIVVALAIFRESIYFGCVYLGSNLAVIIFKLRDKN